MRLEFFPYPLLIGSVILALLLAWLRRRHYSRSYLFFFSVFWMYLLFLASVVVFPIPLIDYAGWHRGSAFSILSRINLVPFSFGGLLALSPIVSFQNLAGNVLLTVPFGFGISFIAQVPSKRVLGMSLAVGSGLETAQLIVSLVIGAAYRGVDINDVLLNATGVLIGYGFFRVFAWAYLATLRRLKGEPKGPFAYLQDVAGQAQSTERATPAHGGSVDEVR